MKRKVGNQPGPQAVHYDGADLTPDQIEFGRAIEKFKRDHDRPHPTYAEVLEVAKALGYRRTAGNSPDGTSLREMEGGTKQGAQVQRE